MPNVIDGTGAVLREVAVHDLFTSAATPEHALFRAVHREFANARAGTASTKKRDEVSGGGKKPWRQKGTGRARQGSIRSPQWRHGGVVFGPQPRSYAEDLNKKERRAAFVAALADRFRNGAVTLLDAETFAPSKTAQCVALLFGDRKSAARGATILIVHARGEENAASIARAVRNLQRVRITDDGALDVKDVLRFERLVFTTAAYDAVVERLARSR
ncbi:MAG TPA: 50S ribosomal protein L4 [Candidatus Dormibacteraeota bacterium]|nr:50S ribosomal protein L4 [Candidatus Dormibacteraeota bacterium]